MKRFILFTAVFLLLYLLADALEAGTYLTADPTEINAWEGGQITFYLDAGPGYASRSFALFGTLSGTTPGTPLPGGLVLPVNWDPFTELLFLLASLGHPHVPFFGALDQDGKAEVILTIPSFVLKGAISANFAFCLYNPFDFVSDAVEVVIHGYEGQPYVHDDGTSDNSMMWSSGGHTVWMHSFDAGASDSVYLVSTTFGVEGGGAGPPVGTPCSVYVWDDPNDDGNPVDCVLLGCKDDVVRITNSDTFNLYYLDAPVQVEGIFFVGARIETDPGLVEFTGMDMGSPYTPGAAWFTGGTVWDPTDLSLNPCYEMASIGFPTFWLLRANDP